LPKRGVDYERLRRTSEFQQLYKSGRRVGGENVVVFGTNDRGKTVPRFGVSVSRKVGNAVVRNRTKRLLRDAFVCLAPDVGPGWDIVICARPSITGASFIDVLQDLKRVLKRLSLGVGKQRSSRSRAVNVVSNITSAPIVLALVAYKRLVSPVMPRCCRFEPTCAEYAVAAYRRFGFFRATGLTLLRLLRCQPFCAGGYDPVPGVKHCASLPLVKD